MAMFHQLCCTGNRKHRLAHAPLVIAAVSILPYHQPNMRTKNRKLVLALALLLVLTACRSVAAQSNVILGVLEEGPGDAAGEPSGRDVRVIFKKVGAEWQAYPNDCTDQACLKQVTASYPREVTWTIAFDGKNLGQVTSRTPDTFPMYWRVGQQEITSKAPVPTMGKRSAEFGGFLDAEVYRPLVAISQPNFHDPDVWKPAALAAEVAASVRKAFRKQFPKLCRVLPPQNTDLGPFSYKDQDLRFTKSYSSKTGWTVVRLHLEGAVDCEDTEAGFEIPDRWFLVDRKGMVRYLESGMILVDAGDYDGDGKSELLFSLNDYNRGGYRIYYDDFNKSADFKFGYH
jgi:hypothetical protein